MTRLRPVHFSALKRMSLSAAHARYALEGGEQPQTVSLQLGSASHTLALGTGKRVITFEGTRRGKAWDAFRGENPDAIILNAREFAVASGMAKALHGCPEAMRYLEGEREVPLEWDYLGRRCATRGVDVIGGSLSCRAGIRFLTELKTTKCAKPEWFQHEVLRRDYATQLKFYEGGVGVDVPELVIVAVESAQPHPVVVFRVSDKLRLQAEKRLRLWMELLLTCEASGEWPGYAQSVIELDIANDAELDFTGVEEDDAIGF